jgi:methylmalonyl-CoA mutase N-terminal domain/subunit
MEQAITAVMEQIESLGGMVEALRTGALQKRIAERAYEWQKMLDAGEVAFVGQNVFTSSEKAEDVQIHRVPVELERAQVERLKAVRAKRDAGAVEAALAALEKAARGDESTMPAILQAVRAYATVGEITKTLLGVFGRAEAPEF